MTTDPGPKGRLAPVLLGIVVLAATVIAAGVLGGGTPVAAPQPLALKDGGPDALTLRDRALRRRLTRLDRPLRRGVFPSSHNVGVPRGLALRPYRGPCVITRDGTVIDAKLVNCDLTIRAGHVLISRSRINGYVSSGTDERTSFSFTLRRSTVDASPHDARQVTAVGEVHFTVIRSHVYGGNRGANCWYVCRITQSYFHGQDADRSGSWHESGIRMGQKAVLRGNTIACDAPDVPPDGGCSAPLTGYGDFGPVQDDLVVGNLFKATPGGTCAYGGSTAGKPFSQGARDVRFLRNVFERGRSGRCGRWSAVSDFDPHAPGNVWKGNVWAGGGAVRP